jgi:hypothetical protein
LAVLWARNIREPN